MTCESNMWALVMVLLVSTLETVLRVIGLCSSTFYLGKVDLRFSYSMELKTTFVAEEQV